MTELIQHRVNTIEALDATPTSFGVEVDIRSDGNDLIIHHDPFEKGIYFDDWLEQYKHGTLILNVKEEGLEPKLIRKMEEVGCQQYFFLDQSFPFLLRYSEMAGGKAAVRYSEFESLQTAIALSGLVSWVWVDCFNELPLTKDVVSELKDNKFKTCIVSPELQGKNPEQLVPKFVQKLKELKFSPSAICTKVPSLWQEYLGLS